MWQESDLFVGVLSQKLKYTIKIIVSAQTHELIL